MTRLVERPMFSPSHGSFGVVAIEDVAVRGRRQAVELHVAVAARGLGIARRAGGIHQSALRKLRDICQVLSGIGHVFDGLGFDRSGGVRIVEASRPCCAVTSTVCDVEFTCRMKFSATLRPTPTGVGADTASLKPASRTVTRYVPGFTWEKR